MLLISMCGLSHNRLSTPFEGMAFGNRSMGEAYRKSAPRCLMGGPPSHHALDRLVQPEWYCAMRGMLACRRRSSRAVWTPCAEWLQFSRSGRLALWRTLAPITQVGQSLAKHIGAVAAQRYRATSGLRLNIALGEPRAKTWRGGPCMPQHSRGCAEQLATLPPTHLKQRCCIGPAAGANIRGDACQWVLMQIGVRLDVTCFYCDNISSCLCQRTYIAMRLAPGCCWSMWTRTPNCGSSWGRQSTSASGTMPWSVCVRAAWRRTAAYR